MAKPLTDSERDELRALIDAIEKRLDSSNYQMLARAKHGNVLSRGNSVQLILDKEIAHIKRIREMLGLPAALRADPHSMNEETAEEPPLREQLMKKGIEPISYRNVRRVREKREQGKKST